MLPHDVPPAPPAHIQRFPAHRNVATIHHVVVIIQENRTVDNLFNSFCVATRQCANTVRVDPYRGIPLRRISIAAHYDLPHTHLGFVKDYDNGKMDGFVFGFAPGLGTPYGYVPNTETSAYRQMLTFDGVLDDMTFAANQGPSFAAHQYSIAGQAGGYDRLPVAHEDIAENPMVPWPEPPWSTTCARPAPRATPGQVGSVNLASPYPGLPEEETPVCRDHATIFDQVTTRRLTWSYYAAFKDGVWTPTQAIRHLYNSPNLETPPQRVLEDIQNGTLANVAFVTPTWCESDHPDVMTCGATAGGRWVASVVDAIGASAYWNDTVIILYWDDWGGWYDHVRPVFASDPFLLAQGKNPTEYGFRVPYGVISAYANVGTVSHDVCSFSDSLAFIEQIFDLPPLGTEDVLNTGCTAGMLNLNQPPRRFVPIDPSTRPPG